MFHSLASALQELVAVVARPRSRQSHQRPSVPLLVAPCWWKAITCLQSTPQPPSADTSGVERMTCCSNLLRECVGNLSHTLDANRDEVHARPDIC